MKPHPIPPWNNSKFIRLPVRVNVINSSALISAREEGKPPEQALEFFGAMQRQGEVPDVLTYSALISACKKGRQPEGTLELFEAMQRQGVEPNVITYSALISCAEKTSRTSTELRLPVDPHP